MTVWMHAAAWRCGYPADSSYLATGAAGVVTSTLVLVACRIVAHCSRPARSGRRLRHPRTWRASANITHASRSGCTVISTPSSHLRRPDRCRGSRPVRSRPATRTSKRRERLARLPPHLHPTGAGRITARGSRPVGDSDSYPRYAASGPSSHPSLTGPRVRAAQCHGTRCRLCRCAACGPLPFCRSPGRGARFTTAGGQCLACFPIVSLPARQVSTSRRLRYQHPERTVSKVCHR